MWALLERTGLTDALASPDLSNTYFLPGDAAFITDLAVSSAAARESWHACLAPCCMLDRRSGTVACIRWLVSDNGREAAYLRSHGRVLQRKHILEPCISLSL